jgi:hypothetical protein
MGPKWHAPFSLVVVGGILLSCLLRFHLSFAFATDLAQQFWWKLSFACWFTYLLFAEMILS